MYGGSARLIILRYPHVPIVFFAGKCGEFAIISFGLMNLGVSSYWILVLTFITGYEQQMIVLV